MFDKLFPALSFALLVLLVAPPAQADILDVGPAGSTYTASMTRGYWYTAPVDHIMSIPGLSDEDRINILGRTAAKLLDIEG